MNRPQNISFSLEAQILALKEARNAAYRQLAKLRVQEALFRQTRSFIDAEEIPNGSEILVYHYLHKRKARSRWEAPYLKMGSLKRLVLAMKGEKTILVLVQDKKYEESIHENYLERLANSDELQTSSAWEVVDDAKPAPQGESQTQPHEHSITTAGEQELEEIDHPSRIVDEVTQTQAGEHCNIVPETTQTHTEKPGPEKLDYPFICA